MALTFVRTSELIEAKWSELDLEDERWNIPAVPLWVKLGISAGQTASGIEEGRLLGPIRNQL